MLRQLDSPETVWLSISLFSQLTNSMLEQAFIFLLIILIQLLKWEVFPQDTEKNGMDIKTESNFYLLKCLLNKSYFKLITLRR